MAYTYPMPSSKDPYAYPSAMHDAIKQAHSAPVIIPCANPRAMRLRFQGLKGAYRATNQSELVEPLGFFITKENPNALTIMLHDLTDMAKEIEAALSNGEKTQLSPSSSPQPRATDDIEASLARILGTHHE